MADHCIEVPATEDLLATMLEVVPLQLLAYQLAIENGIDVDKPRNLTKGCSAGVALSSPQLSPGKTPFISSRLLERTNNLVISLT